MSCSADYYLVTCSQRRLLCADVCLARTSRRYQNIKFTVPSQFGIVGAANWQRRLVCAEYTSAQTITTVSHSQRRIVGATRTSAPTSRCYQFLQKNIFAHFLQFGWGTQKNCRRYMNSQHLLLFAANAILFCFTSRTINSSLCNMAAH